VFVGRFDGTTFRASAQPPQALDVGEDYYASASWSNLPGGTGKVITLGWMDNWLYAQETPTSPWRGVMAFPRRLSLRAQDGRVWLLQRPIAALAQLRTAQRQLGSFAAPTGRTLLAVPPRGAAHEIRARVFVGQRGRFEFTIGSSDGRDVRIGYAASSGRFTVVRSGHYRFSPWFDSSNSARLPGRPSIIELNLIIDRSSVEAFVDHGELTVAERMFPRVGAYTVRVRSRGARVEQMDLWRLHGIWPVRR
jgi:sucrose-6-phosphate hydrolase SacC (GH32 family)